MSVIDCFESENLKVCDVESVPVFKCAIKKKKPFVIEEKPKSTEELSLTLAACLSHDDDNVKKILAEENNPKYLVKGRNMTILLNTIVYLRHSMLDSINAELDDSSNYRLYQFEKEIVSSTNIQDVVDHFKPLIKNDDTDEYLLDQENSVLVLKHSKVIYSEDVETSLMNLLRNDVAMTPEFNKNTLEILDNFLQLLIQYLELPESFLGPIKKLKEIISKTTSLTGQEWLDHLNKVSFPNKEPRYIACQGSRPNLRGYPCGLWLMFHSLTVGEYLAKKDVPDYKPTSVFVLNRFVPVFFSCRECGINFAIETKNLAPSKEEIFPSGVDVTQAEISKSKEAENDVPKPETVKDAVLYLNRIHNKVNVRISGDYTDDPMFHKSIFPKPFHCPKCYSKAELKKYLNDWKEAVPDNEETLLEFLVSYFNPKERRGYAENDLKELDNP